MRGKICLTLQVGVRDTLTSKPRILVRKESDMLLDNFGRVLANLLSLSNYFYAWQMKDLTGTARNFNVSTSLSNTRYWYIGVGTGGGGPTVDDNNLATQVGSWTGLAADSVWTKAARTIVFSADVLLAAGATVTEAGAIMALYDSISTWRTCLCIRDVFSGVVVAAGKYAHVVYTLTI